MSITGVGFERTKGIPKDRYQQRTPRQFCERSARMGQVTQPAERFAPQSRGRLCDITWHVTVPPERPVSPEILWPGIDKGRYEAAVANAVLGVEERGKPSSRRPDQLRLEPSDGARLHPPGWYDPAS